jgi:hypothetical protein
VRRFSRASVVQQRIMKTEEKIVLNDDSFQRLKNLIIRYQNCATTTPLMSIDAEWD